jgi:primosomal replication protein N
MPRIVRVAPALLLLLAAHVATAQEDGNSFRAIARIQVDISTYQAQVQARTQELGRRIDVLGMLTDAADMVSQFAMDQSLSRARKKIAEARAEADREPALQEPVPKVIDILDGLVASPPFGMSADQLRARLFVEIGKLEEEILHECEVLQREVNTVYGLQQSLGRIGDSLRTSSLAGGRASLYTRKRALKVQ